MQEISCVVCPDRLLPESLSFRGVRHCDILWPLDRFSGNLDFSLKVTDTTDLSSIPALEKELRAIGLNITIREKERAKRAISFGVLKGNTKEHLLYFMRMSGRQAALRKREQFKIKFEVDVNPTHMRLSNTNKGCFLPYEVICMTGVPVAGKIHASSVVPGRTEPKEDLYDMFSIFQRGWLLTKASAGTSASVWIITRWDRSFGN